MDQLKKEGIIILDFGSQYTQLIARRIREFNVYSEVVPPEIDLNSIKEKNPRAIILSGGPSSVFSDDAPAFDINILDTDIPILGICYGLHLLVHHSFGIVNSTGKGEYGFTEVDFLKGNLITEHMSDKSNVWMSHMDQVTKVPDNWEVIAKSSNGVVAGLINRKQNRIATQFHPEVSHTREGGQLLKNFIFKIAKCEKNWTPSNFIQEQVKKIKEKSVDENILIGVSGGVDSTVMACLINMSVGKKCTAVLIDHGMLRKAEAKNCVNTLKKDLGIDVHIFDESNLFFSRLAGITDPEKKRKVIGDQFIKSFDRIACEFGDFGLLGQGTLYPDIIESGVSASKSAHVIKSHHNVGGLPNDLKFGLIEPLKDLFKDEVRAVGKQLGISDELIFRHPFPGPGLGVRIIGEVTRKRASMLQEADHIYMEILKEKGEYENIWQAFAVLIPVKTVGVMGDQRTYENLIALRAVTSVDGMTADWYKMPYEVLSEISSQIVNNVKGINRVVYDVTSKPPGTIEWE